MNATKIALAFLVLYALPAAAASRDDAKPPVDVAKKTPIYDPKADARVQLDTATARAKRDSSRVLVMFGFETCSWCQKLHALFQSDAELRKLLGNEFVKVQVDIKSPNADKLLQECKDVLAKDELAKGVGYPFLAVIDGNGKILTAQRTDPFEEDKAHDAGRVKEFLSHWAAPPADARKVLEAALARAVKEDKRVFLHFGSPWCGWCHRLEEFLARAEVAAILGPDFVDVKIDIDRMKGGQDVLESYCKKQGGIPWFAFLNAEGKALVNSDAEKGNIGFPYEPPEVEHFLAMLKQTARKMDAAQFTQVEKLLRETREEIERKRKKSTT